MLWCPLANMLPMALRMTMANVEMTMLLRMKALAVSIGSEEDAGGVGDGPCIGVEDGDEGFHCVWMGWLPCSGRR